MSPNQAGLILGVTARRVAQLCDEGVLPFVRTPLGRLIPFADVRNEALRRGLPSPKRAPDGCFSPPWAETP